MAKLKTTLDRYAKANKSSNISSSLKTYVYVYIQNTATIYITVVLGFIPKN